MKFTVNSKALRELVAPMMPLTATNTIVPICETIYFGIDNKNLTLKATNLSESMKQVGSVESSDSFEFCIDAKGLFQLLSSLPDCPLETEYKSTHILISSATGKYKLPTLKADDFVRFPDVSSDIISTISSKALIEAVHYAGWSYSSDQLRPAMCGVLLEIEGSSMTIVSTDGNKLAKAEIVQEFDKSGNYIIPGKGLSSLIKLLPKDETIEFSVNPKYATFYFGNTVCHLKLIDEEFPDFRNAIPQALPYSLWVNRMDFIACLNRMSFVFNDKSDHHFVLTAHRDNVKLVASNNKVEAEFNETLPCEFTDKQLSIAFNAELLKVSIQRFSSERICFSLAAHNRAALIMSEDEDEKHVLHLVMPILLPSHAMPA